MFANLYVTNNRKIFKIMQLFKLNALKLLLMTDKKHERYIIIENFENQRILLFENHDGWKLRWSEITKIKNNNDDDEIINVDNRNEKRITFKIK